MSTMTTDRYQRAAETRALAKSAEQADAGNFPRFISRVDGGAIEETTWSVASRTEGGTVYLLTERIDRATGERAWTCECPAAIACWHRVHAERGSNAEIPIVHVRRWG